MKFKVQSSKFKVKSLKFKAAVVLLFVFWGLFGLNSVQAVGLIIKPTEINISARARTEAEAEFLVVNIEAEPAIYQISPDALLNEIKLEPADFQLEPNASQLVKVKVKISEPGRYQTNISVIARPLGAGGLTLASGVKLPLMIEVSGWPLWAYFAGVILLIIICLLIGFGVKWILSKGKQDKFSAR